MPNHGVFATKVASAVSTPIVANTGIPYVVGTAPVHAALNPAKVKTPVLVTTWDECKENLGYSTDWKNYTLCEFMYSHFMVYGCQPVIFYNALDPAKATEDLEANNYSVTNHRAKLPFEVLNDENLEVKKDSAEGEPLSKDSDYSVVYDSDENACFIELLSSGTAYEATTLNVAGKTVTPSTVKDSDIIEGINAVDQCMNRVATIPDLLCAPGYSHKSEVAAIMATKASAINGLFFAKALIDIDSGEAGAKTYQEALEKKGEGNLVDPYQILCWPMVTLGGKIYHQSTHYAGLAATVDNSNDGVPYESASNKSYNIDGACLEDGTEINLTLEQANVLHFNGIVTALNFMSSGWVCWGDYTACYPASADVKDQFIPISRMFDYVGNTMIRTFWSKLDKPMNRMLLDSIKDSANIWLDGLVGSGYVLGARVEILDSENPLVNLMQGIIKLHIYMTPPSPAQEIDFVLQYDESYVQSALMA